jgi:hypothetical protein
LQQYNNISAATAADSEQDIKSSNWNQTKANHLPKISGRLQVTEATFEREKRSTRTTPAK